MNRLAPTTLLLWLSTGAAFGAELTLERIFSGEGLEGAPPTEIRWRPDGKAATYLLQRSGASKLRDLWQVDVESGAKAVLVRAEQLARLAPPVEAATQDERERERRQRYSVAGYRWAPDSRTILFSGSGRLFLYDAEAGSTRALADGVREASDAKFSPDGRWVSFVNDHDLWLVPTAGGKARQLTFGGSGTLLHGELDWVYPEELRVRSGYEWAPDSAHIAFLEMDESDVPVYPIPGLLGESPQVALQRYPRAGDPNPRVRVGVVKVHPKGKRRPVRWVRLQAEYIARLSWADSRHLALQSLNRAQNRLELGLFEIAKNRYYPLLAESDEHWINVSDDLAFLAEAKEFLWTSERSGFRHIYRYGVDGVLRAALTKGDWEVEKIVAVAEKAGWVYYTSNEAHPLGYDLFRVKLDGARREKLTSGEGTHAPVLSPARDAYLDSFSGMTRPPALELARIGSGQRHSLYQPPDLTALNLQRPELFEIRAADGGLIRGHLLKPWGLTAGKRYPLVLYVYGGPRAPTIWDSWMSRGRGLFHHYLARQGYVVVRVDDRASSIRGHRYESALARDYGPTALRDHLAALDYLKGKDFIDPERVAIWGWSGGGFATCFALTHSNAFKVGIAVAPVTDWRLYDSIYTERYMGAPERNAEAYERTSAIEAAANLSGRLLLVHGTSDDNVHLENAYRFIDALVAAGKPYDLQVYPGKTHSIRGGEARLHLYRTIERYLREHL